MKLNVLTERPVLGSFSKAIDGSFALNFARSGGKNCDQSCVYHPDNESMPEKNRCYAARIEVRPDRRELRGKLDRHEDGDPSELCKRALSELKQRVDKGHKVPWLRISAFGSVPQSKDTTKRFLRALRELMEFCDASNIPVHFPVETREKAEHYRKAMGTCVTVRQSAMSMRQWNKKGSKSAMSIVAGTSDMNKETRLHTAKAMAVIRREATGRKTIVCPAVASRYNEYLRLMRKGDTKGANKATTHPKSKCGNCTACAQPGIDIVYPAH